jgi:hypothetical protein
MFSAPGRASFKEWLLDHLATREEIEVLGIKFSLISEELESAGFSISLNEELTALGLDTIDKVCGQLASIEGVDPALKEKVILVLAQLFTPRVLCG